MNKKSTNLILIISTLTLIALLGAFVYLINVIKNKNKHISVVAATLQEKIDEKDNMKVLEKKMVDLGDTRTKINGYFVDTSNIDTFVEYLEGLGDTYGATLVVQSVDTPKNEKNKLVFSIEIDGNFSNVTKIVSILENSPYNINFNSLYINKITETVQGESIDPKSKAPIAPITKSSWQATANFNVLSF